MNSEISSSRGIRDIVEDFRTRPAPESSSIADKREAEHSPPPGAACACLLPAGAGGSG